jgi:hypothetical protein
LFHAANAVFIVSTFLRVVFMALICHRLRISLT